MDYRARADIARTKRTIEDLIPLVRSLSERVAALEEEMQRRRGGRPRKERERDAAA